MSPDYRALCVELTDRLEHAITSVNSDSYYGENCDAVDRARATLAQPELEGVTDDELCKVLYQAICEFPPTNPDAVDLNADQYELELEIRKARAVLARWCAPANTINQEDRD